ncbi:MAG: OB-fold domain-containing protein [Pseudomonadota bacterium]|nr:OB-fold domain-containing protein [Pseudomonadota bacterium]
MSSESSVDITGYGAYIPRLRLSRKAVVDANAWFAPNLRGRGKGTRAMANWDEDSITMAVAAARDCLGKADDREHLRDVLLASSTLPFAERLNAGVACGALRLPEQVSAVDLTGTQTAALAGLSQALAGVGAGRGPALLLAADVRKTLAASSQELDYGDGAAALRLGTQDLIAEIIGEAALTTDFVDRFRLGSESIDYHWEERWVRDEGIAKLMPRVVGDALTAAGLRADAVDHFIFPSTFAKADVQLAKQCGIRAEAVVDNLAASVGDSGVAHGLLLLAATLEQAQAGRIIVLAQFGNGARAFVLRTTDRIGHFRPRTGVAGWLARGVEEHSYTRYLVYKDQLPVERGMRGEQDRKTALTTAFRHRDALLGFVAGRCRTTGAVSFPPSRFSYTPGAAALDTQEPYPLAERRGRVLSWSAEYLSFHLSPPHQYGQVDFEGGGRVLMDFTDVSPGDIATGTVVEPVFRIKDIDDLRGYKRYFWKAVPLRTAGEQ